MGLSKYIDRYLAIDHRLQTEALALDTAGDFTRGALEVVQSNNYVVHSAYGNHAQALVFGVSRKTGGIDQQADLERILTNVVGKGDALLCHGSYQRSIGRLKVSSQDVHVMFNADTRAVDSLWELRRYEDRYGNDIADPQHQALVRAYIDSLNAVAQETVHADSTGIISVLRNGKKRAVQLVDVGHVYADFIGENLKAQNISYIQFVPGDYAPLRVVAPAPESIAFAQVVRGKAETHNYREHASYGTAPRVFLFGFTHPGGDIAQEDDLAAILKDVLQQGDAILMEGHYPCEVVWEGYHKKDLLDKLRATCIERGIRVIFNDDGNLIGEFFVAASRLRREGKPYEKELEHIHRDRDRNFCLNRSSGIIQLAKRTAKIKQPLAPTAHLFQLAGAAHIESGVMDELLQTYNVPYVSFLSQEQK